MSNYAQDEFTKHAGRIQDVSSAQAEIMSLLNDCARMTWEFYPAISVSCLQLHHLLPFVPRECRLWQVYGSKSQPGFEVKEGRLTTWSACARVLEGHTGAICAVAFSPDGGRLVSGSADLTVRLWNVQTGAVLKVMEGHRGPVY